jgi:TPR repeat protein
MERKCHYCAQPFSAILSSEPLLQKITTRTPVDRDREREAVRLYKLAADQGDASAQVNLGYMYERGRGIEKNEAEAARLYQLAADQGNALAQNNLGAFYTNGRGGLTKDDREAARFYKLAADQGNALGQNNLGFFYRNGLGGLPKDDHEAARFYKLAADQGNAFGQNNLGVFYHNGLGLPAPSRRPPSAGTRGISRRGASAAQRGARQAERAGQRQRACRRRPERASRCPSRPSPACSGGVGWGRVPARKLADRASRRQKNPNMQRQWVELPRRRSSCDPSSAANQVAAF